MDSESTTTTQTRADLIAGLRASAARIERACAELAAAEAAADAMLEASTVDLMEAIEATQPTERSADANAASCAWMRRAADWLERQTQ